MTLIMYLWVWIVYYVLDKRDNWICKVHLKENVVQRERVMTLWIKVFEWVETVIQVQRKDQWILDLVILIIKVDLNNLNLNNCKCQIKWISINSLKVNSTLNKQSKNN